MGVGLVHPEGAGLLAAGSDGQEAVAASRGHAPVLVLEAPLYDPTVLRTIFVDFENEDWEQELQDFHGTDIEVPAVLTVDGQKYGGCGVRFRGMSSYMMVQAGHKRSLNISMDFTDGDQRLRGYKTLNLLNCSGDATLLSTVLYSYIANKYIPAPKANLVRVVINGENWGIYTNVQQFNKQFVKEHYGSSKGSRWKVAGSPRGGGGLEYRGEDPDSYGHPYVLKGGKKKKSKAKLIELCRVLNETPVDQLEAELSKIMDVDELLWFLALDIGLCNSDGYWTRASDYSLFLDRAGRFHVIPHDMNEAFRKSSGFGRPGRGRGGRRGRDGRGSDDIVGPLHGIDDPSKPLRSKVLAVPALRAKYLERIRVIAAELDWQELGPVVKRLRELVSAEVKRETRGLSTYEEFLRTTGDAIPEPEEQRPERERGFGPPRHGAMNLREFAQWRRQVLLDQSKTERR